MTNGPSLVERVRQLSDDHLFANAPTTDSSGRVPEAQLDLLRDAGLYGLHSPVELGGLGAEPTTANTVLEMLARGCLTTAFVWSQHAGPARASAATTGPMNERWARPLATGAARGGVAFAHLLRAGAPVLIADPTDDGWVLNGTAPFVTGWGHVDVVLVAARHRDQIVWAMIDAVEATTAIPTRLVLAAVDSSVTVRWRFENHMVATEQVTHVEPFDDWRHDYHRGLRSNGSLALGVAGRCAMLLGESPLDGQLDAARKRLDQASTNDMPDARTEASLLALRAAAALVAASGGSAVAMTHHAQRLAREAMFTLVQGQTEAIRSGLLSGLTLGSDADR